MKVEEAASAAHSQFVKRIDEQVSRKDADKDRDIRNRDDSRAVNKSNADRRAANIAAERGGVDIKV